MKFLLSFLAVFIGCTQLKAQIPHLSGKVDIVMATGQITCDLTISNIPDMGRDYQVLLNKGFNIKAIRDFQNNTLEYSGFYGGTMRGEGLVYAPQVKDSTMVNPRQLRFTYTGAFPVYRDTLNFIDFKGLIAFNGKTMRAADQSKWYPIIYDVKNDRLIEQVTFDIQVTSKDARTLFVNGDLPKPGPVAGFQSSIPIAPMLFIGDYGVQKTANALFLNTEMNEKQLTIFEQNIAEIKAFYYAKLKIPYETKNVFIEHQAVEKYRKGRSWGFVAFPTIAFAGFALNDMIDEQHSKFKDSTDYPYIAHEIAHYYFGNVLQPNATLFWFFLESTAEYLSVKAGEAKFGKQFGSIYFREKASALKELKVKPLNSITDMNQLSGTYRYNYGPFLLRGLEQIVGEAQVYKFLNACLTAKQGLTNYDFLKANALRSGIGKNDWEIFERDFLQSENAVSLIR